MKTTHLAAALAMAGAALFTAPPADAHGDRHHGPRSEPVVKEQKPWGIAGDARAARRTIEVRMGDDMRFSPDRLEFRQGETVRILVRNTGNVMHEFVMGTRQELDEHAALMKKFPTMEHDEPYMAHVPPGKAGEIVWAFNRPGDFDFACLIAGHHDAGMVGKIRVTARQGR